MIGAVVFFGVPVAAALVGLFLMARGSGNTVVGGIVVAMAAGAAISLWQWFEQGCFEGYSPCATSFDLLAWGLWVGAGLGVVATAIGALRRQLWSRS